MTGALPLTLVIFSGLPGTGKSTLADLVATETGWPVLRIDDIAETMAPPGDWDDVEFWDRAILELMRLVESRLDACDSVIVDSVFMDRDRFHARQAAREAGARFVPVHTFVSDEAVWEQRVERRVAAADDAEGISSWERIGVQRRGFRPWREGTALMVDGLRPVEENRDAVVAVVTDPSIELVPLPETSFQPGRYHDRPDPRDPSRGP